MSKMYLISTEKTSSGLFRSLVIEHNNETGNAHIIDVFETDRTEDFIVEVARSQHPDKKLFVKASENNFLSKLCPNSSYLYYIDPEQTELDLANLCEIVRMNEEVTLF